MGKNTTFAIAVGSDPADLTVEATDDGFGSFQTEEEAALRLIEIADSRIDRLRASRSRAKRLLRRKDLERAKAAAIACTAGTPAPQPASDGWIKWEGGECPVAEGTMLDVRYRDGTVRGNIPALVWADFEDDATEPYWENDGISNDIVAYRIVEARDE